MNFYWQNEATNARRVLVRGCRQSGKTYAACTWARSAGGPILFVVNSELDTRFVRDGIMAHISEGELHSYTRNEVTFANGSKITILPSTSQSIRGMRFSSVVLQDIDKMGDSELIHILSRMDRADFKLFASYTGHRSKAVQMLEDVEGMTFVTVDYLDLLESGVFNAEDIRGLQAVMTEKNFSNEFGPYDKQTQKTMTNKSFSYLLKNLQSSK